MSAVSVQTVYSWELRKLAAQKRTYIGLGCALLIPLIFIGSLLADDGGPEGIPFGNYVRESGLAIPLVGLFFGAFWFFPLITALVAGDIVAAEDGNGTLKTILTRSVDRWQIFVAKVLAGGADNALVTLLKKRFTMMKHAKPPASRKGSVEWFVVAQGFKARSEPTG